MSDVRDIRPKIDLKRRAARKTRLRRLAVLLVVLLLSAALAWLAFFSSVFTAKIVKVTGNSLVTSEQVVEAAQVQMGVPLARQNLGELGERVATLPPVKSVKVSRGWPSSIKIKVTERTPLFQLRVGEQWHWVDEEGVAFYSASEPNEELPRALAQSPDAELLVDVAEVLKVVPAEVLEQVTATNAMSPEHIVLELTGDRLVNWGSSDNSAEKARVLVPLLAQPGQNYDVSAPSNPAIS